MSLRRVSLAALPLVALVLSGSPAYGTSPVVIRPGHLGGWTLTTNKRVAPPYDAGNLNPKSTASYAYRKGPGTPPTGTGSLLMSVGTEQNSRVAANPPGLTGRTFGAVTELRYATYLESGGKAPINLKLSGTSAKIGYTTAVFEPARQSTTTAPRTWQHWNARAGTWWATRVASGACSQGEPCSWKALVARIGKTTTISTAYFELGDSGTGFSGEKCALDDVTVNGVTYSFEASAPAPVEPTARVTSGSAVGPGGAVTVRGAGFKAGERVSVTLHSQGYHVGTATADGSGDVTATFTVPAGIDPGQHVILLHGLTSGRSVTVTLTVTGGPKTGFGGMARIVAAHHPA